MHAKDAIAVHMKTIEIEHAKMIENLIFLFVKRLLAITTPSKRHFSEVAEADVDLAHKVLMNRLMIQFVGVNRTTPQYTRKSPERNYFSMYVVTSKIVNE